MNTIQILFILSISWFLLGVISIWRMYWGEIKEYHIKFNIDKRLTFKRFFLKEKLYRAYIVLFIYGPLSLLVVEIFLPTCWYYKIPKIIIELEPEEEQTDFGTMYN